MSFSQIDSWLQNNLGDSTDIIKLFLVVFITALISYVWRRFHTRLHLHLQKTKNSWDDALVIAVSRPVIFLIWGAGSWIIFKYLFVYSIDNTFRDVGLVFLVSWFLVRFVNQCEANLIKFNQVKEENEKVDHSTIAAISKLLRVSVSITTTLVVLQTMGVSISAVLAFGGIGGIAIGFAAKDLLANFFGGLMIYLDRPFSIGDWIRSSDREIEGTVEYIGWRQTRIRTFDKRPLYVPNAIFNSITVENPSRMKNRRIYETFGVRYDDIDVLKTIVEQVKTMLFNHPEIDNKQTLIVNVNQLSESSIDFFIYTFTKTTDWIRFHEIKQSILLEVATIIAANKAELAYPTQRLQVEDLSLKA